MSINEKLFYGWTMHLPQVGRYGKHGPDFEPLINHVINFNQEFLQGLYQSNQMNSPTAQQ